MEAAVIPKRDLESINGDFESNETEFKPKYPFISAKRTLRTRVSPERLTYY